MTTDFEADCAELKIICLDVDFGPGGFGWKISLGSALLREGFFFFVDFVVF